MVRNQIAVFAGDQNKKEFTNGKAIQISCHLLQLYQHCLPVFFLFRFSLAADDSVCARVKIEIKQELTLERQAFDAHMRINNGLTHAALENINVDVWATNEDGDAVEISTDPNDPDALFLSCLMK